jgi:hypothetical protein
LPNLRNSVDKNNQGVYEMVSAISNAAQAQPVAQYTGTSSPKPAQAAPRSSRADSVQLSAAAQAALAAQQEARETASQTAREASSGDLQARRLLAREAAAKPAAK